MRHRTHVLPNGQHIRLFHRDDMRAARPARMHATLAPQVPATALPVDSSGGGTCPCPMDQNDACGDCGLVMCAHVNGLRTFGQGKPGFAVLQAPVAPLVAQYLSVSDGDNGTTEDMLVGNAGGPGGTQGEGVWLAGIAGDVTAVVEDHLDLRDGSNKPLLLHCLDYFYAVCKAWSVPDQVLQTFQSGISFLSPLPVDPANGHFTPISDVDASGNYRDWTWGGWFWESPEFMAATQPELFVTFSALQFRKSDGFDSKGRHISDVGAAWVALGGNAAIVTRVISMFPGKPAPPAPPPPAPEPDPATDPGVVSLGSGGSTSPVGPASEETGSQGLP